MSTLRRPEYFSVGDVAVFEKYESEYEKLTEVPKADDEAFTAAVRALPQSLNNAHFDQICDESVPPAAKTRSSSPMETISKPAPCRARVSSTAIFELAFTA